MKKEVTCEHRGITVFTRSGIFCGCHQEPETNPSLAKNALTLIRARPVQVCAAGFDSDCIRCTASQMVEREVEVRGFY